MDDENAWPRSRRRVISDFDRNAARDLELIAEVYRPDGVAGVSQSVSTQPGRLTKPGWASEQSGNGDVVKRHEGFACGRHDEAEGSSLQRGKVTSPRHH